jgi:hypothetical protein
MIQHKQVPHLSTAAYTTLLHILIKMQLHAVHTQACAKITYIANAIFIKYTAVLFDGNKMANWPIENDNSTFVSMNRDQKNRDNNA